MRSATTRAGVSKSATTSLPVPERPIIVTSSIGGEVAEWLDLLPAASGHRRVLAPS
jgi:hypothetical protein